MIAIRRTTTAAPKAVFDVLADGWIYPVWVVGASRMREVDDTWPHPGARLHHSFGIWPLVVDDTTLVLESEPPHWLVLKARGWPFGEATVRVRIDDRGQGSLVTIEEDATRGPALLAPKALRQKLIGFRNHETLRRLTWLAEGRAG